MCNTQWAAFGLLQANCCYVILLQSPWLEATSLMHPSSILLFLLSLPLSPHSSTLSSISILYTQQLSSPLALHQLPAGFLIAAHLVSSSAKLEQVQENFVHRDSKLKHMHIYNRAISSLNVFVHNEEWSPCICGVSSCQQGFLCHNNTRLPYFVSHGCVCPLTWVANFVWCQHISSCRTFVGSLANGITVAFVL